MAISRAQLAKELEPGLNALLDWSITDTKTNMQRSSTQRHLIVLLKKK